MAKFRSEAQRKAIMASIRERLGRIDGREVAKAATGVAAGAALAAGGIALASRGRGNPVLVARAVRVALAGAGIAGAGAASLSERIKGRLQESEAGRAVATGFAKAEGGLRQGGRVVARGIRTLAIPGVGAAEDLSEAGANALMTLVESKLAKRIQDSADRLERNAAQLTGTVNRAMTEELVSRVSSTRGRLGKMLGKAGELTEKEATSIRKLQERILADAANLENVRKLRRRENKSLRQAAIEAYNIMRTREGGVRRALGGIMDDDIKQLMAEKYPTADLGSRENLLQASNMLGLVAGLGGVKA